VLTLVPDLGCSLILSALLWIVGVCTLVWASLTLRHVSTSCSPLSSWLIVSFLFSTDCLLLIFHLDYTTSCTFTSMFLTDVGEKSQCCWRGTKWATWLYRTSQEKRSIFWEVIVSVILSKNVYMNMCSIPNGFRDGAIWLYSGLAWAPSIVLPSRRAVLLSEACESVWSVGCIDVDGGIFEHLL
jgi:hypothetical protein